LDVFPRPRLKQSHSDVSSTPDAVVIPPKLDFLELIKEIFFRNINIIQP
jgi:hypothetical protein